MYEEACASIFSVLTMDDDHMIVAAAAAGLCWSAVAGIASWSSKRRLGTCRKLDYCNWRWWGFDLERGMMVPLLKESLQWAMALWMPSCCSRSESSRGPDTSDGERNETAADADRLFLSRRHNTLSPVGMFASWAFNDRLEPLAAEGWSFGWSPKLSSLSSPAGRTLPASLDPSGPEKRSFLLYRLENRT